MRAIATLGLQPGALAAGRSTAERAETEPSALDRLARGLWHGLRLPLAGALGLPAWQQQRVLAAVQAHADRLAALDDAALQAAARALRPRLQREGLAPAPLAEAFALVREAGTRLLGRRHHPCQLAAGWWLLQGRLVEMATGEGKTYTATLAAITAALAGLPVHVLTTNDYLAGRDAQALAPLYRFFGLRVGAALATMTPAQRRQVYAGEVAYASAQGLAFDYLRDRAAAQPGGGLPGEASAPPLLRGLVYAIVDEADSVFIDEGRTPLVLAARAPLPPAVLAQQAEVARQWLALAADWPLPALARLDAASRRATLTDAGLARLRTLLQAGPPGALPPALPEAQAALEQALAALHLYRRDRDYVLRDGQVCIVDEATGRAMPDRSWERGLHQMIEAREGLPLTAPNHTIARLTTQRLFRRYLRLAGMSGTVRELAAELGAQLGLGVVAAPLHRPCRRRVLPARCLSDATARWQAVADEVQQVALGAQRPVLVGTRSVAASQALSAVLAARGIAHAVLNALQDADEAAVVAAAGQPGRVTVATDMAGRGTDIPLAPGVAERGGLHVVLTEYAHSPRIDRQLVGRAGRQGEPGSAVAIVAADDALFVTHAPGLQRLLRPLLCRPVLGRAALALLRWAAQRDAEASHRAARADTEREDRRQARMLAYSGRGE